MNRIAELRRTVCVLAICVLPALACALPEDDAQQIVAEDFASTELFLDEGVVVQKAHPDQPTCIRQGTRAICGAEITIERAEDNTIRKVTAVGTPARFEQKPTADQEVVHFSGLTLVFDNDARLLTIEGDAQYSQGQNEMTTQYMEYHLDAHTIKANGGDSDEQGRARFAPDNANGE